MEKTLNLTISARDKTTSAFASIKTNAKGLFEGVGSGFENLEKTGRALRKLGELTKLVGTGGQAAAAAFKAWSSKDPEAVARAVESAEKALEKMPYGIGEVYALTKGLILEWNGVAEETRQAEAAAQKLNKQYEEIKKTQEEIKKTREAIAKTYEKEEQDLVLIGKTGAQAESQRAKNEYDSKIKELEESRKKQVEALQKQSPNITPEGIATGVKDIDNTIASVKSKYDKQLEQIDKEASERIAKFATDNRNQVKELATENAAVALGASGDVLGAQMTRIKASYDTLIREAVERAKEATKADPTRAPEIDREKGSQIIALEEQRQAAIAQAKADAEKEKTNQKLTVDGKIADLNKAGLESLDTAGNASLEREKQRLVIAEEYKKNQDEINKLLTDPKLTEQQKKDLTGQLELLKLKKQSELNKVDLTGLGQGARQSATIESRFGSGAAEARLDPNNRLANYSQEQLKKLDEQTKLFNKMVTLMEKNNEKPPVTVVPFTP